MASCSAVVKKLVSQLLLLVGALFATTSFATAALTTTQSIDDVRTAAEEFVRSRLPASHAKQFVTAAKLDSRLRVGSCAQPLETFEQSATNLGERVTVGVRCSAANTWTLYVPVLVEVEIPVLVLRRALARRARVAMIDVEPQTRRVPGTAATFLQDTASLQGHRLKRSLPAGTALTVDMLVPDLVVRRGQQVTLIAASGPVEIRAQGHALTDGGVADRVRVQNTSSLKVVEGIVGSDGAVRVGI
jgi:flagella basal body P-ring formation protein FlgA